MTHLSMDMLLALRDRSSEPGTAAAAEHLRACGLCQVELERLHQRVAQIRALPTLRPTRDLWPAVSTKIHKNRGHRRNAAVAGLAGLAMAASLTIVVVTRQPDATPDAGIATVHVDRIHQAQERSRELEKVLNAYPDSMGLNGQTSIAQAMEDRIAEVDRAIERAEAAEQQGHAANVLQLWQEKVGLLDALVNVHVNRASHVEF